MPLSPRSLFVFAALTVSLAACRKKPEPAVVPPQSPSQPVVPRVNQDSIDAANRAAAEAAERARLASAIEAARAALLAPIYFDYNMSDLTEASRATLESKVAVLNANPNLRLRISGHTDERGSDEYNLALGQRRAAAARRYLEGRGIAASRIDIVSFGEERPVAMGGTEADFARNRRDEFEIVAGGDQLRPADR
jgi:peptidoglycan-associated lipoprotein